MTLGRKPDEQVLKELALDCVKFRGKLKVRHWTFDAIKTIAHAIKNNDASPMLEGIFKNAEESSKYSTYIIKAFEWKWMYSVHLWMLEMGRIEEVTPKWVAGWTSLEYMYKAIRADYAKLKGKDFDKPQERTSMPKRPRHRNLVRGLGSWRP